MLPTSRKDPRFEELQKVHGLPSPDLSGGRMLSSWGWRATLPSLTSGWWVVTPQVPGTPVKWCTPLQEGVFLEHRLYAL